MDAEACVGKNAEMTDAELAAESAAAIAALIAALQAKDTIAEAAARDRMKAAEIETLTRQIAALQPKAAPPPAKPVSRYDAFCGQCERCRHHHPCAFAKNSSLTCPGPKYRGFTFEAA